MLPEPSSALTVRPKEAFAVTLAGGVVTTSWVAGGADELERVPQAALEAERCTCRPR